jgi:hypothetical protein
MAGSTFVDEGRRSVATPHQADCGGAAHRITAFQKSVELL